MRGKGQKEKEEEKGKMREKKGEIRKEARKRKWEGSEGKALFSNKNGGKKRKKSGPTLA